MIAVDGYSERWLRQGFPWVYPKEVAGGRLPPPGQEVEVRARGGALLGRGIADDGWIAVRVFRHDGGPIDANWIGRRLEEAAALRARVVDPKTTGFRLVHGENDGLPGLRVDWWDPFAVIALDSASLEPLVPTVASWLLDRRGARGIYRCLRPDPREVRAGSRRGAELVAGEPASAEVRVTERGLAFRVRPTEAPDVGLYADMREVRAWLEPHWKGRTLLNTFAYTGAFTVSAAAWGSGETVSVDLSEKVLERARENLRLNGLPAEPHAFVVSDTFEALDRYRRKKRTFDVVILDPPSFSRAEAGTWSAKKDLPRLVAAACRVLAPDGWLVAASNQGEVSPREFDGYLLEGFRRAERAAQQIHRGGQAPDFPAGSWFPEGRYLKVGIWRVL